MEHGGGAHEIGVHQLGSFLGMTVNIDTLYMTWLTMGLVLLLAVAATRSLALVLVNAQGQTTTLPLAGTDLRQATPGETQQWSGEVALPAALASGSKATGGCSSPVPWVAAGRAAD